MNFKNYFNKMSQLNDKIKWCLNKAQKEINEGKKHRGLLPITPDINIAREHINKSQHNLRVTLYLHNGGFTDWCSSSLFYTIYHCFLGILAKYGYESRNQECTFAVIENLIGNNEININIEDFKKVISLDVSKNQEKNTAINLRENSQYSTKTSLKDTEYKKLLNLAKKILDDTKIIIEE
ncbi:MAG: hypothetical protein QT09_C0004G0087 [archaeon GW2011_AR18]|nr:MAG: hypothetical protein QT09_C0004G0087 [archaeon GW2011_AR18]